MKKTYINPTTKVVKLHRQNLLLNMSMYGKNATGEAMARDFDDFEDFDD